MRLSTIIELAKQYLIMGIILAAVAGVIAAAGYFIVYKKVMKGEKRLRPLTVVWAGIFLCYLVVMFSATLLDRFSGWTSGRIIPLFYSYREAWYNFSGADWRNIVLNILLFVPLGFLLPLGIRRCRRFWVTYLIGFVVTVLIESAQLILRRGVVEADDILNNFLGTMIGYGCYMLFQGILSAVQKRKFSVLRMAAAQIPLVAAGLAFAGIVIMYDHQELGNLNVGFVNRIDLSSAQVTTEETYSSETGTAAVYKVPVYTEEETRNMAEQFFERLGQTLDGTRIDLYEETAIYYSTEQNSLWINYSGGTMEYVDFSVMDRQYPENETDIAAATGADETTVREALLAYGIDFPENAEFQEMEGQSGGYTFTVSQRREGDLLYDGTLTCTLYEDEKLGDINNNILTCEKYKDFPVISEEAACEQVRKGYFQFYLEEGRQIRELNLGQVTMKYMTDSKGYYQPVYTFTTSIDGQEDYEIYIPAVEQ